MSDKHLRRAKKLPELEEQPQHTPLTTPADQDPLMIPVEQPLAPVHPPQPLAPMPPPQPQAPMYQPQQLPPQPYPVAPQVAQQVNVVVNVRGRRKSVVVALLLAFLFGPLGMFYSTVFSGLVMLMISPVAALLTLGMSLLITWPICMIWAAMAAND